MQKTLIFKNNYIYKGHTLRKIGNEITIYSNRKKKIYIYIYIHI